MHSVYERVIINSMLLDMTDDQLLFELTRASAAAVSSCGAKHIVNMSHVTNVRNHLIRRGVEV